MEFDRFMREQVKNAQMKSELDVHEIVPRITSWYYGMNIAQLFFND